MCWCLCVCVVIVPISEVCAEGGGAGDQSPETALRDMIGLLEAKNFTTFVKRFAPADIYDPAFKENRVKELESEMRDKAKTLLYKMKTVKDAKPEIRDKRIAVFRATGADGQEEHVKIILEKKGWCLR